MCHQAPHISVPVSLKRLDNNMFCEMGPILTCLTLEQGIAFITFDVLLFNQFLDLFYVYGPFACVYLSAAGACPWSWRSQATHGCSLYRSSSAVDSEPCLQPSVYFRTCH